MKTIQNCGGDAATNELCVKSVKTLPILGGEKLQGMKSSKNSNNAKIVAYSVARNVEDPFL